VIFGVRKCGLPLARVDRQRPGDGHIVPVLPKVGGYVVEVRVDENQSSKPATRSSRSMTATSARASRRRTPTWRRCSPRSAAGTRVVGRSGGRPGAGECVQARADLARVEPLAAQNIVSQQQLDAARAAAAAAEAQLAQAQAMLVGADARVAAARASRDQAALQLSYTRIITPSAGVVSKKAVELGQLVQAASR